MRSIKARLDRLEAEISKSDDSEIIEISGHAITRGDFNELMRSNLGRTLPKCERVT